MRILFKGEAGKASAIVMKRVQEEVENVNGKAISRGVHAVNALRNAELRVLKGQRSGKVYKKPGTYGQQPSKATRKLMRDYGHKLRGGQLYRASAPGEPPARRTGNLRLHWNGNVKIEHTLKGSIITVELKSQEPYANILEEGLGMAPRPFVKKIKDEAIPMIRKIYSKPYK